MYAIDIETHDPNLKLIGDGSIRRDGHIYCVGVYGEGSEGRVEDVFLPSDPQLANILRSTDMKVFHNGVYDMTWLVNGAGFIVNGMIDDTMTREVLIDEQNDSFSLESCCRRRAVQGKNFEDTIDRWAVDHDIRFRNKGQLIDKVWDADPRIVADYCIQDCRATYALWKAQQPLIDRWELQPVVEMEAALYPILMEMKRNGLRIDVNKRDAINYELMEKVAAARTELEEQWGIENINSPVQIRNFFNSQGVHSSLLTKTGNESYGADALSDLDHPAASLLHQAKTWDKARGTFISGYFTECAIGDRVHATFYPSLRDEGGTITGRFSSRNPNMQNIPSDDRTLGPLIRSVLVPDDDGILCAWDYKQIEYMIFAHYAIGRGAEQTREAIRNGMDYHSFAQKLLRWDTPERQAAYGWSEHDARKMAKNFNFGSIYGLGKRAFKEKFRHVLRNGARAADMDVNTYADRLYDEYFRLMPFVRPTCQGMQALVQSKGYMRSIGKRIHHRPLKGDYAIVNYICQGGASDMLKAGLVNAWKAGIFNEIRLHITVHDENVFTCFPNKRSVEAAEEFARCMADAITLKVPICVDKEAGNNWAVCSAKTWNEWKEKHG